ncbi:MAG TPA: 2-oxoglutarate dehydrogenase complex dihydrolipoyllysine-residue succinyltransferase [Gemmatimonadaceae bacterium]|nr:2-oxoglutarate dehydrogenase complex dihydrolipoyllysine-residue succinyltransferase [Gemmatimonadaceae bacterium]
MTAIKVPPLGESIVEATVSRWLKAEGDAVAAGDTLVELETDKITVEVPALKAGVLTKRARQEGDVVKVDEVLGEVDESAKAAAREATREPVAAAAGEGAARRAGNEPSGDADRAAGRSGADGGEEAGEGRGVSPAARRAAAESGVDVGEVKGTGRGGVVSKPDVVEHTARRDAPRAAETAAAPAATPARAPAQEPRRPAAQSGNGARETREKMTTRRKRIAENLLLAKQATASLTTFNEIDMAAVMALRERSRDSIEKRHGIKLTYMPFFVKAACQALAEFPNINAQIDGESIVYKHYVNMGIAVASDQGLVVPTIKDADRRGLIELSREIVAIAKRARDGKLTMDDLTGGTFTITNGGVFGSLVSTPILNYPQVGILGLHKYQDRPVAVDGQIVVRPMMYVALTYDHRIVDGQHSVQFLVRIKELMEDPARMLLE